jgi:murein DD-endopeptidase MepM/ murein hydrolase activator NlpD
MKRKLKSISTVIILNKDQHSTKTLQVKTKHISRFKHYVAVVLLLVISLSSAVIYLKSVNSRQEAEKQQLQAQLTKLKGTMPSAATNQAKSAQSYIQAIEGKLQKINDYLRRRGLPGFSTKSVGGNGNVESAKLSDNEKYSLYDEYLARLVKTVAFTPLGYPRVSSFNSVFGYRADPFNTANAEFHPGIDFQGKKGDPVKCTANGTIVFAGWANGYGNCIRIQHINNIETVYGHLSHIGVKVGQQVNLGDVIGAVGSTGHSTGTHLHYEVRKDGKPVNPVKYLTLGS